MQSFLAYFAVALLAGGGLLWLGTRDAGEAEVIYGVASSEVTEVNFDFPVEVEALYVAEGDPVRAGDSLLRVRRVREKERPDDQELRIGQLRAEARVDAVRLGAEAARVRADFAADSTEVAAQLARLRSERDFRRRLLDSAGAGAAGDYDPDAERAAGLEAELRSARERRDARLRGLARELSAARRPVDLAEERLRLERSFEAARASASYRVDAPVDGILGTLSAEIAEHKSAFAQLATVYAPRPDRVRAFVHEERSTVLRVGDEVRVTAFAGPGGREVAGVISGLGARIVEIPTRLRRVPEVAAYGREVRVDLPADNPFLQGEKVVVALANAPDS